MLKQFREFAMRGNVVDLAVAFIMGAAFGAIVTSLVNDIIMPPIGMLLGNVDFTNMFVVLKQGAKTAAPYASLADAKAAGAVTINYGVFINTVLIFIIVAFVLFLIVRYVNKMREAGAKKEVKPVEATTKECTYCKTAIPVKATRCPNCTSQLSG